MSDATTINEIQELYNSMTKSTDEVINIIQSLNEHSIRFAGKNPMPLGLLCIAKVINSVAKNLDMDKEEIIGIITEFAKKAEPKTLEH